MARREAWKTFEVTVREVRGDALIHASVTLSHVTGVDGTPYRPKVVWAGPVSRREPGFHLGPEEAAQLAAHALRQAYPGLF